MPAAPAIARHSAHRRRGPPTGAMLVMVAALLCALAATPPAHAVDWVRVSGNGAEAAVYVNRHSIQREGTSAKAWVMWDFSAAQQAADASGRPFLSHKAMLLFNCDKRELAIARFAFYTENFGKGEQFGKQDTPRDHLNYLQADPNTVSDAITGMVCAKPARKRK